FAPEPFGAGHHRRPFLRQRPDIQPDIAAEEVLVVVVIPMLGQSEGWRRLIAAYLFLHVTPGRLVRLGHEILPDQTRTVGKAIRMMRIGRVQQQAWRLDRVAGDYDVARLLKMPGAEAMVLDAVDTRAVGRRLDAADHGAIADLRAGLECTRDPDGERALLGIGGTADAAEAAIDAGRRLAARRGHGGDRAWRPVDPHRLAASHQQFGRRIELVGAI